MSNDKLLKFSPETLEIIESASHINNSLKFVVGNRIRSRAELEHSTIFTTIAETIPAEFAIYDLKLFLHILKMPAMADAEIDCSDTRCLKISSKKYNTNIDYYTHTGSFMNPPSKDYDPTNKTHNFSFLCTREMLNSTLDIAKVLKHTLFIIEIEDGNASLLGLKPDSDTNHKYTIDLGETEFEDGYYRLLNDRLRLIPGDYQVDIYNGCHIVFKHTTRDIVYAFGLERN